MGMIQQRLTEQEYQFCKYIKNVWLPNRNRIDNGMIAHAEELLGIPHAILACPNCSHQQAVFLYNKFEILNGFVDEYEMIQKMAELEKKSLEEANLKVNVEDGILDNVQPKSPQVSKNKKQS